MEVWSRCYRLFTHGAVGWPGTTSQDQTGVNPLSVG